MWTGGWVWRSPYNLHCWGPAKKTCSPLCQGRGSLEQILSCCLKALGEGRYKWRHYKLRKAVSDTICACIQPSKHQLHTRHNIMARKTATRAQGLNRAASLSSWRASEDRPIRQLKFPQHTAGTSLRPDMVLTSDSSKHVVMMALTVPSGDRMVEAHNARQQNILTFTEEVQLALRTHLCD